MQRGARIGVRLTGGGEVWGRSREAEVVTFDDREESVPIAQIEGVLIYAESKGWE